MLAIAVVLPANAVSAQGPGAAAEERADSRRFRFAIEGSVAGSAGGPGGFLGSLFLERGFDDRAPSIGCLFLRGSGRSAQRVVDPGLVYMGSARLRFGEGWSVAAFVNGPDGVAAGGDRSPGYGLRLKASSSTAAVPVGYRLVSFLDVSAGPALHHVTVEEVGRAGPGSPLDERVLGALVDVGAELPVWDRVFLRLFGQDRWMPDTGVGSVSVPDVFQAEEPFTCDGFDLPGRHVVGGVGVGVRF